MTSKATSIFLSAGQSIGTPEQTGNRTLPTKEVEPGMWLFQGLYDYLSLTFYGECSEGTIGTTDPYDGYTIWTNDHAYSVGDVVFSSDTNSFWIATSNHTSSSAPATILTDIIDGSGAWNELRVTQLPTSSSIRIHLKNSKVLVNTDCMAVKLW